MNPAPNDELGIVVTEIDGARVLRLTGEFDIGGVGLFLRHLNAAAGVYAERTVLDLRELSFIDSSGLRELITADLRMREEGRHLVVMTRAGRVHEVLELTGLSNRLDLVHEASQEEPSREGA